jgi:uncharacterized membrane protein YphA (DoxX/SURF4 family)
MTQESSNSFLRRWPVFLRVALGLVLIWKAIKFVIDTAALQLLTGQNPDSSMTRGDAALVMVLSVATVVCAIFIMLGVYTRVAAFVQLPVFIMGTLYIHGGHIERQGFERVLTIIIPFVLLLFITKGNSAFLKNTRVVKK